MVRSLFIGMLALSGIVGCAILGNAAYLLASGQRELYENGKLAHGFYLRLSGFFLIAHSVLFYVFVWRTRRIIWPIAPLYLLSFATTSWACLVILEDGWKSGIDAGSWAFVAIALFVAWAAIIWGSRDIRQKF